MAGAATRRKAGGDEVMCTTTGQLLLVPGAYQSVRFVKLGTGERILPLRHINLKLFN